MERTNSTGPSTDTFGILLLTAMGLDSLICLPIALLTLRASVFLSIVQTTSGHQNVKHLGYRVVEKYKCISIA